MFNYLQLSVYIFILSLMSFSTSAQGISMSPTRLFLTGSPGETINEPVVLSNSSNTDYVFNVNLKDWKRKVDGEKVYSEAGSLENSNSSWISTVETSVSLPAKSSKEVMVTMKIPENASTTEVTNSMLFFTQIGKQKDREVQQNGIGIITLFEFGLHVYYTPPANNEKSLNIVSIEKLTDEKTDTHKVEVGGENDGNVVNDATVQLELTNTESGEEIKLEPINISMLPGANQTVKFSIPESLKGAYFGVSIIKMAGTNDLRVGEKNFKF